MTKKTADRRKAFHVFAKFENLQGRAHIERCVVRARYMPIALRAAVLTLWREQAVRWKHFQLAVLCIQPITEESAAELERTPRKRARRGKKL